MKLFDAFPSNGEKKVSIDELALKIGADPILVGM
jgi:hypothetical protein